MLKPSITYKNNIKKLYDIVVIKLTIWHAMTEVNRKKLGTIFLVIATFLNPFGYDLLVFKLTQLTKDYWITIHILYVAAVLFFTLFFICYKINPIILFKHKAQKITDYVKKIKKNGKL